MIIEKLSSLTIKVSVTENELRGHSLSFELLSSSDAKTVSFISYVLSEIRENLGINLHNENLYIEAFSCINNNCILYISAVDMSISDDLERPSSESGILTFETTDPKKLIWFSEDIMRYCDKSHIHSVLYHRGNTFRLLIEPDSDKADNLMDMAFSHDIRYSSDNVTAARTEEYFLCIIEDNAVAKLSGNILL